MLESTHYWPAINFFVKSQFLSSLYFLEFEDLHKSSHAFLLKSAWQTYLRTLFFIPLNIFRYKRDVA